MLLLTFHVQGHGGDSWPTWLTLRLLSLPGGWSGTRRHSPTHTHARAHVRTRTHTRNHNGCDSAVGVVYAELLAVWIKVSCALLRQTTRPLHPPAHYGDQVPRTRYGTGNRKDGRADGGGGKQGLLVQMLVGGG